MNMVANKVEQLPAVSETAQVISMIARVATDPNCDMDKMAKLMEMRERELQREAKQAYAGAMIRVQSAMPSVFKGKENKQTKSFYADLEAVTKIVTPVYTAEGFSLSFNTGTSALDKHVLVICTVLHCMGHSERFEYDSPIDDAGIQGTVNKTPQHGRASAISYAQRYLTKLIFNLILSGEDNDGNGAGEQSKWLAIADALTDYPDYLKAKEDLKKAFPMVEKIPPNVKAAFNAALERTKPKD